MKFSKYCAIITTGLFLLTLGPGCGQDSASPSNKTEQHPFRILKVAPSPWAIGDSVMLSFEEVYDNSKWMPGGVEIQLPSPEPNFTEANTFELLWIPDNTTFTSNPRKALVHDGFLKTSHEFEIASERTFSIHGDSIKGFYFKEDHPSKVLDTIFFEEFFQ